MFGVQFSTFDQCLMVCPVRVHLFNVITILTHVGDIYNKRIF